MQADEPADDKSILNRGDASVPGRLRKAVKESPG